ncbi:MAG: phage terminase large subunit, partial [Gammaproteobacteria bacterium]|nr:phage terminase large subunit [Gammaproteobacteria bacterium]
MDAQEERKLRELALLNKDIEKNLCEESYYFFFTRAWKELEPENPLILNWHIRNLCNIVQLETERIVRRENKAKDYIINVAPRTLKSYIFNIMWTPWAWTRWPFLKFITNSFMKDLSTSLCVKSRTLILTPWYQNHWGHIFQLSSDMSTKSWYENNRQGLRRSISTTSGFYGSGADVILNDDPQDPKMAGSELEKEDTREHYRNLSTRLNNRRTGLRVNIQQRLAEDDLTGYLLENNPKEYYHICLPVELTDNVRPVEWRKYYKDGLFFPSHPSFTRIALDNAKLTTNLGAYGYASQMLQEPSPEGGSIFKKHWWRYYKPSNIEINAPVVKRDKELINAIQVNIPEKYDIIIDSWDTAFDGTDKSDDVVGVKIGKVGANKYILHVIKGKYNFKETKEKIKYLHSLNHATSAILVEKSANGYAIVNDLESSIAGIIPIKTGRLSKEQRVRINDNIPYAAQVEAGNIYLPHPSTADWVNDFVEEHAKFPTGKQDGQVDACGQAINYLSTSKFIWSYFNPSYSEHKRKIQLDPRMQYYKYGSIFINQDGSIHLLFVVWDIYNAKLYITYEMSGTTINISDLAFKIVYEIKKNPMPFNAVWCNGEAYDANSKSVSQIINTELNNYKIPLYVNTPFNFDRLGSIELINLMFSKDQIVVDNSCVNSSIQFSMWASEYSKAPTRGFELCECLCLVVSQLSKHIKIDKP